MDNIPDFVMDMNSVCPLSSTRKTVMDYVCEQVVMIQDPIFLFSICHVITQIDIPKLRV